MKRRIVFIGLTIATTLGATLAPGAAGARLTSPGDATDIRTIAPSRPPDAPSTLARPETGSDLASVSSDWARREVHLVTNGADERFLNDANEKLDRLFGNERTEEFVANETGSRDPASELNWLKAPSVHMSRVGEIEFGFNSRARLSCDLAGGNGPEWELSRPVSSDVDVRLHHESNTNSLQVRLNW